MCYLQAVNTLAEAVVAQMDVHRMQLQLQGLQTMRDMDMMRLAFSNVLIGEVIIVIHTRKHLLVNIRPHRGGHGR